MQQRIILASTSPRRKELLSQIGLDFEIMPSDYVEDMTRRMSNARLAKTLAYGKAKDIADKLKEGIVIGSDTFIVLDGQRIGKPKDEADAKRILETLSGRWLSVYSGIAVIDVKNKREIVDHELTKIKFKPLSQEEITDYLDTKEPLDKAGAYALQGRGAIFVERINGCYSNVIGLPLHRLYICLQKIGIKI